MLPMVHFKVIVDDGCVGCGVCWVVCPKGVLTGKFRNKAMVVSQEQCMGCFSCQINCPYGAIRVVVLHGANIAQS